MFSENDILFKKNNAFNGFISNQCISDNVIWFDCIFSHDSMIDDERISSHIQLHYKDGDNKKTLIFILKQLFHLDNTYYLTCYSLATPQKEQFVKGEILCDVKSLKSPVVRNLSVIHITIND